MNKNRKHLTLHIGQTKAGSTAIQNYLDTQREVLLAQGVSFPKVGFSRGNPFDMDRTPGHLHLLRSIVQGNTESFEEELRVSDFSRLILSAENLFLDRSDKELSVIGDYFNNYRCDVVIIVRSLTEWLKSRYVEDCMSGFKLQTDTLEQFCADKTAQGAHDYASRLKHVARLLRAGEVKAINYDVARHADGIVAAFLQAAGLPETDTTLARSIRANIREKDSSLTEGKRRINHVLPGLPVPARLELESRLRTYARELAQTTPETKQLISTTVVPLSESDCLTAILSNRRLVSEFGLASPLQDPHPAKPVQRQHREHSDRMDDLVRFGLKEAVCLFQREAREIATSRFMLASSLTEPGLEVVVDALADARVSLHIGVPATAVMASCFCHKLTFLAMVDDRAFAEVVSLQEMLLPSEIIEAGHGTYAFVSFGQTVARERHRLEVIVVAAKMDTKILEFWLNFAPPECRVFVVGDGSLATRN